MAYSPRMFSLESMIQFGHVKFCTTPLSVLQFVVECTICTFNFCKFVSIVYLTLYYFKMTLSEGQCIFELLLRVSFYSVSYACYSLDIPLWILFSFYMCINVQMYEHNLY